MSRLKFRIYFQSHENDMIFVIINTLSMCLSNGVFTWLIVDAFTFDSNRLRLMSLLTDKRRTVKAKIDVSRPRPSQPHAIDLGVLTFH